MLPVHALQASGLLLFFGRDLQKHLLTDRVAGFFALRQIEVALVQFILQRHG
jgi:hypothetical protein